MSESGTWLVFDRVTYPAQISVNVNISTQEVAKQVYHNFTVLCILEYFSYVLLYVIGMRPELSIDTKDHIAL